MCTSTPDEPFSGAKPRLTEREKAFERRLREHVRMLAEEIGPRHLGQWEKLQAARQYLREQFARTGYEPHEQVFSVYGKEVANVGATLRGTDDSPGEIVVGAHYDTVPATPGADDNASGVALMLVLAGHFVSDPQPITIHWVAFVNEEPPYFQTDMMGSWVYAKACRRARRQVKAMVSLESVGYFTDEPNSQDYPPPFGLWYPSTGNFIGFLTNLRNRDLLRKAVAAFRRVGSLPCESAAIPAVVPGVGWSDHWAFWQEGYPAFMVTDTAPFRNPHYHTVSDRPDTLDYERMARLTTGMIEVIRALCRE